MPVEDLECWGTGRLNCICPRDEQSPPDGGTRQKWPQGYGLHGRAMEAESSAQLELGASIIMHQ
jgi:hypothetical protein